RGWRRSSATRSPTSLWIDCSGRKRHHMGRSGASWSPARASSREYVRQKPRRRHPALKESRAFLLTSIGALSVSPFGSPAVRFRGGGARSVSTPVSAAISSSRGILRQPRTRDRKPLPLLLSIHRQRIL